MTEVDFVRALDERGRYELFARLRALEAHWPRRFETSQGDRGRRLLNELEPYIVDRNRYLKLRRIALARIAAGRDGEAKVETQSAR